MVERIGTNLGKEYLSKSVTIEIYDRIFLDVKAMETGGKIESVVDDDDNPLDNLLEQEGLLVDEITMDALEAFFENADIEFVGDPWKTDGQDDFLGRMTINCTDLNTALKNGKVVLNNQGGEYFTFEGLDEFVDTFKENHFSDAKYNEDEEDSSDY